MSNSIKGILNNKEILNYYKEGSIKIDPFNEKRINPTSYDISIGPYFYREKTPLTNQLNTFLLSISIISLFLLDFHIILFLLQIFLILLFLDLRNRPYILNPYNNESIKKCWKLHKAINFSEYDLDNIFSELSEKDSIILVNPGETILCSTEEFIGSIKDCNPQLLCKSSWGRNFLSICKCSSWGNIGFINRWTLEITNNSRFHTIPIVVGQPIGQIVFHSSNTPDELYSGNYQNTYNLETLKQNWKPENMLPRVNYVN